MRNKINLNLFGEHEDAAVDCLVDVTSEYPGVGSTDAREIAKLAQFIRVADALEGIQRSLEALESLQECVHTDPTGSKLYIAGTVASYEPQQENSPRQHHLTGTTYSRSYTKTDKYSVAQNPGRREGFFMKKMMDSKTAYNNYIDGDADKLDIGAKLAHEEKGPEAYGTMHVAFENYLDSLQAASFREGYEYALYLM